MRLNTMLVSLGLGYVLILMAGCGPSRPSAGLWSDGIPDPFVEHTCTAPKLPN
jgi:hypothetical protein